MTSVYKVSLVAIHVRFLFSRQFWNIEYQRGKLPFSFFRFDIAPYHPFMLQISHTFHWALFLCRLPLPPCEGDRGSSIGVAVMKHKLQQKELSLNHNLMEDAPESAQETA